MKKVSVLLIIVLSLAMAFLGCNNTKGGKTGDTGGKKDELILAIGSEPEDGFDPTIGWGRYGSPLFQSTIFVFDNDFNIINDLATGHDIVDDGLTWIVKIREDVKFSDGQLLTAEDIVYTYETAKNSSSVVDLSILQSDFWW